MSRSGLMKGLQCLPAGDNGETVRSPFISFVVASECYATGIDVASECYATKYASRTSRGAGPRTCAPLCIRYRAAGRYCGRN